MKKKEIVDTTPSFNPKNFGKQLTECLKEKGVTKEDLAIQLCCTIETITKYEQGTERPNSDVMVGMAQMFKMNPIDFLRGSFDKPFRFPWRFA